MWLCSQTVKWNVYYFVSSIYQTKLSLLVIWSVFQTVLVKGTSDLLTYIEASQLTPSFGGTLSYDHKAWIKLQKVLTVPHLSVCFPFKGKLGNLAVQWFKCMLYPVIWLDSSWVQSLPRVILLHWRWRNLRASLSNQECALAGGGWGHILDTCLCLTSILSRFRVRLRAVSLLL